MMKKYCYKLWQPLVLIFFLCGLTPFRLSAAPPSIFLEENFSSLERWAPLYFPNIDRYSTYTVGPCGDTTCLRMASDNSASGLVLKESFNVYQYPLITWRWKVSNIYKKGDASKKEGDDYPARLYILFAYDEEAASFGKQLKYNMAKLIYGQYPPDSSISYIWANKPTTLPFIFNAYTDQARMIAVSSGKDKVNTWQEYSVNIVEDYMTAFGKKPPATASLAVMCDSDNTHESAQAVIEYIRIERKK
nr:DUF3047 domain-containing protein [uncultured Desulfobulbus sp.]